jgi:heavy metal translocating P-type ATPase
LTTSCKHCGLPTWDQSGPYCCSGCRFIDRLLHPAQSDSQAAANSSEASNAMSQAEHEHAWLMARLVLCALLSVVVMMFSLILYAEEVVPGAALSPDSPPTAFAMRGVIRLFLMAVATPVYLILGWPLLREVLLASSWRERATESLILAGAGAAYGLSVFNTLTDGPKVYFETGSAILFLVSLGRSLDARAKSRAARSLASLASHIPRETLRLDDQDKPQPVSVTELRCGERILLRPGDVVPVDGSILSGHSELDEAMITGEFDPAHKGPGQPIFAGARNLTGALQLRVEKTIGERTVDRMENLVRQAWQHPGKRVEFAQRLSRALLPLSLLLAIVSGLWWGWSTQSALEGLQIALSVVLIACPCALGLATPLALWVGLERCARRGLLLQTGAALEDLGELQSIFLDKTGTLTRATVEPCGAATQDSNAVALALCQASSHPISRALQQSLQRDFPELLASKLLQIEELAGQGLRGSRAIEGQDGAAATEEWRLGRPDFIFNESDREKTRGWIGLTRNFELVAQWQSHEELAPGALEAVRTMKGLVPEVMVLTGDSPERAERLANTLLVPVKARLLPDEKLREISRRANESVVLMVGDGLNDAPALAAANVSLAMASGIDLSREVADGLILGHDLRTVAAAILIAAEVRDRIRANLFWAFAYNGLGLLLAVAGRLNPVWAAFAMVASSATIVATTLNDLEPDAPQVAAQNDRPGSSITQDLAVQSNRLLASTP